MIKKKELLLTLEAMAILVGTIIGGGIFVLPYMNIKSGIVMTNVWLIFLCVMVCLLHLIFGEIILKTKDEMKLPGYAGKYLGKMSKKFLNFVSIFSIAFSLLIYIVLADKFIKIILGNNLLVFQPYLFILIWLVLNVFLLFKLSDTSRINFVLTIVEVGLMVTLAVLCFGKINFSGVDYVNLSFSPVWYSSYGVIFFAIDGLVAMPMMFMFLKHKKASKSVYKKSVIWSFVFVFLVFFAFMNSVSLLSSRGTSIDAINGLVPFLGRNITILGSIAGLFAVLTSYIVIVNYFKDMLRCDVGYSKRWSILLSMFLPLGFLLLGAKKLDDIMSLAGGIIGGMIAVIVLLIYQQVKNKNKQSAPYNLNLSKWSLIIIGSVCFVGAIMQIVLRIMHLE